MKVVLIRPQIVYKKMNKAHKPAPPLGLALLAAALKKDNKEVTVIDGVVEKLYQTAHINDSIVMSGLSNKEIIERIPHDADVIGFSCMFTVDWLNLKYLINETAEQFKNARIIAGGEHITALPEFCLRECPGIHLCVLGEGEDTIVEICHAIENNAAIDNINGIAYIDEQGEFIKTNKRERIRDLDSIPMPAWELFPVDTYFKEKLSFGVSNQRTLPILATRGCPYTCTFCSSPAMWGTRYSMRSVNNVVDEIEFLVNKYQVRNIDLYDLTAIINAKWIIQFCKEILARNLDITWQLPSGTRSEAITPEVLHHMKLSGCSVVSYAPESGSERMLEMMRKKVRLKSMLSAISNTRKAGIYVKVNIILGFPDERHEDIWKTIVFILKCSWYGAHDMGPNPFYPIPGTVLFDELSLRNEIDIRSDKYYDDLLNADNVFHVIFYNNHISPIILRAYYFSYLVLFYSSNYALRPLRFFKTIRNVVTQNAKTRGEYLLQRMLKDIIMNLFAFRGPKAKITDSPIYRIEEIEKL